MATPIITAKDIRVFLMDKPELNPLLMGVKWTDEEIDQACTHVVDHFNVMIPQTGNNYTVENFPSRYLLLIGVAGHLLRSAAINDSINQFDYAVEGVTVQDKNKAELFIRLGNLYWEEYKKMGQDLKIAQNVNMLYGDYGSEYRRW